MKKVIYVITAIVVLFIVIMFINKGQYTDEHPTLNETARMPDQFLKNSNDYLAEDRLKESAISLERAIASIWKIERDVDTESFEKLEAAIKDLEAVHHAMVADSLESVNMNRTFEYTLDNLARAELEIAELYAETNKMENANIALKYAQLHIKNAMLFHKIYKDTDTVQLAMEKRILDQMKSLSDSTEVSPVEYVLELDRMIKEIDQILQMK